MTDSAPIMISMTYYQRCETLRFAKRKIRFVFAVLGLVEARKRNEAKPRGRLTPQGAMRIAADHSPGLEGGSRRRPGGVVAVAPQAERLSRPLRGASERGLSSTTYRRPKLRKTAVNRLKSLARVNLCAGSRLSRKSRASPRNIRAQAARRVRPPAAPI